MGNLWSKMADKMKKESEVRLEKCNTFNDTVMLNSAKINIHGDMDRATQL